MISVLDKIDARGQNTGYEYWLRVTTTGASFGIDDSFVVDLASDQPKVAHCHPPIKANAWLADRLGCDVGDLVCGVRWFEPYTDQAVRNMPPSLHPPETKEDTMRPSPEQCNARFWAYINGGPVKITLRPDQCLSHATFERTEEGWSGESHEWRYEDGVVYVVRLSDGVDCDGRISRMDESACKQCDLLSGHEPYVEEDDSSTWDGVVWPQWEERSSFVHDREAERMGY